jgi:hypothetical protein
MYFAISRAALIQIVAGSPAPRIYIRLYNESFSKNLTSTARMEHRAVLIAIEVG